jgi:hypothetical protein
MSVVYFTDEELSLIHETLAAVVARSDFIMDITGDDLKELLVRLSLSNRMAYEYTYRDEKSRQIVIKIPIIESHGRSSLPLKDLIKCLDLLDYNCVTNSGRSFLDNQDKDLLDRITHLLRLRYIRVLEKQ